MTACDVPACPRPAVARYLVGWRCLEDSPAVLAGRTVPDPAVSAARLPASSSSATRTYGHATDDPRPKCSSCGKRAHSGACK